MCRKINKNTGFPRAISANPNSYFKTYNICRQLSTCRYEFLAPGPLIELIRIFQCRYKYSDNVFTVLDVCILYAKIKIGNSGIDLCQQCFHTLLYDIGALKAERIETVILLEWLLMGGGDHFPSDDRMLGGLSIKKSCRFAPINNTH